jgi:hypothetical protein
MSEKIHLFAHNYEEFRTKNFYELCESAFITERSQHTLRKEIIESLSSNIILSKEFIGWGVDISRRLLDVYVDPTLGEVRFMSLFMKYDKKYLILGVSIY